MAARACVLIAELLVTLLEWLVLCSLRWPFLPASPLTLVSTINRCSWLMLPSGRVVMLSCHCWIDARYTPRTSENKYHKTP